MPKDHIDPKWAQFVDDDTSEIFKHIDNIAFAENLHRKDFWYCSMMNGSEHVEFTTIFSSYSRSSVFNFKTLIYFIYNVNEHSIRMVNTWLNETSNLVDPDCFNYISKNITFIKCSVNENGY